MAESKALASPAVRAARSVGAKLACALPASRRLKSSSVLTSLERRRPLRRTRSSSSRMSAVSLLLGEHLLQGPEHEGQGRAELVAHVGEEGRLDPVQLGERLRAQLLLLIGARVGEGRGQVAAHQLEEALVRVVEREPGAQAHHEQARERAARGAFHREDPRPGGEAVLAAERRAQGLGQGVELRGLVGAGHLSQPPLEAWT